MRPFETKEVLDQDLLNCLRDCHGANSAAAPGGVDDVRAVVSHLTLFKPEWMNEILLSSLAATPNVA